MMKKELNCLLETVNLYEMKKEKVDRAPIEAELAMIAMTPYFWICKTSCFIWNKEKIIKTANKAVLLLLL